MLQVTIPVHPMSRLVMLAEFGSEPIVLENKHFLFEVLNTRIAPDDLRGRAELSGFIELQVNPRLAARLAEYGHVAGIRLFKYHKDVLCRFVNAQTLANPKMTVMSALKNFLAVYSIEEDHYSLDAAWKLHQRFDKEISQKNPHFLGHKRRNPSVVLSNFSRPKKAKPAAPDSQVELAAAKFMSAVRHLMKRPHRRLPEQATAYLYAEVAGYNARQIGEVLGIAHSTAHHRVRAMQYRCDKNPTYARLIAECIALPEPA